MSTLRLAVAQSHTLSTTALTLAALSRTAARVSTDSVDLLLFPEAYLGGYPRGATFGATIGARDSSGREQFLRYWGDAVDLGDTPQGGGRDWVEGKLERPCGAVTGTQGIRGDGTREELERIARATGVFLVTGLIEKAGGTLYCAAVYVCPREGIVGKRRKVMPTGSERLVWGQGQPSSLRAITTTIRGVKVTLAAAICWENYMPLLRQSLYSQNVTIYLAPTADARDTWLSLMRTVACEGRCVVLSANQCIRQGDLPDWVTGRDDIGQESHSTEIGSTERVSPGLTGRRRSTAITDEGHEIALPDRPAGREVSEDGDEEIGPEGEALEGRTRRRSMAITDDGHEIVLPDPSLSRRGDEAGGRRFSAITEDGYEIALPRSAKTSPVTAAPHPRPSDSAFASRGGSCIISPLGNVLAGPLWEDTDGLLVVDVDMEDSVRGRLDLDVGGSYSRSDAFQLTVAGLDLSPPP